jgi:hypothetical protein
MYKSRKLDKKSLKMPTRLSKAGNRKSDNTWLNEKRQNNLKIVDNILDTKLKIEQHEAHEKRE